MCCIKCFVKPLTSADSKAVWLWPLSTWEYHESCLIRTNRNVLKIRLCTMRENNLKITEQVQAGPTENTHTRNKSGKTFPASLKKII